MKIRTTLFVLTITVLGVAGCAGRTTQQAGDGKLQFTTTSEEARGDVGEALISIENFRPGSQILPLARKAVAADPQFAFAHYLLATATFPPAEAKPHMEKALELSRQVSDGERRYIEAAALIQDKKPDEATQILVDLGRQYPRERMVQMLLGQSHTSQGKFQEAKAAFEKAIEIDGSTPRAYSLLGNVYLLSDDYAKAREMFQQAINNRAEGTAPNGPYYGLAFSHLYQEDLDSAVRVLEQFRDLYLQTGGRPDLPVVFIWNSIGRVLLEHGRPREALKAYEQGYESVPGSPLSEEDRQIWLGRLHHGRGRALARMGRYQEAWREAEIIKKMIDQGGERGAQFLPAYHYLAGYVKLESGDIPAAIEHLQQADQTDPFRKLLLARAYEKAGNRAGAQKIYQEIVGSTQNSMERALAYPEARKRLRG
ncbi:MAG: tetratricopeptide repeat protein [Acidobacteria bacterium]|nr:tetratricopeptide repeat protein [Acidobacteriota bacterium]